MKQDDLLFKIGNAFLLPFALVAVCIVRLLRPVVVIRFGKLISTRIGHFAGNTELYLCERDMGLHGNKTFDIFYHSEPVCNQQLAKMWGRVLRIYRYVYVLYKVNRWLPSYKMHEVPMPSDRDTKNLLSRTRPHISFTPEEELAGKAGLKMMGIPDDASFVCIYGRDPAYLKSAFPDNDWNYHDYRDCEIQNFLLAADELTKRGYFVIRMGSVVANELVSDNPRIIDYATKRRTDFMDVYLCAKCSFFLGVPGGIIAIPIIFRRPLAIVNSIPIEYILSWNATDIMILKKLKMRKNDRFMSLRDIMNSGAGKFSSSEEYEKMGVEVVQNTSEEIAELALEMDERLNGRWEASPENDELQQIFWSLFKDSELHGATRAHIGADFLRSNKELFGVI